MNSSATDITLVEYDGQTMSEAEYAQRLMEKRNGVLQDMLDMRNRWMEYRRNSGVEQRWRKASMLYFGYDLDQSKSELEETLKNGPSRRSRAKPNRSRVRINIIRPKVDQAVARLCEIMLPVDGSNFGLEPTPVADAVAELVGVNKPTIDPRTGQPTGFTADEEAVAITSAAAESVAKMEKVIQDQQAECGYNAQIRLGMEDMCRLGTKIIEGPVPQLQRRTRWAAGSDGQFRKVVQNVMQPISRRIDLWDVWFSPDCGNDHQRGAGYWKRVMVSRKELRELKRQPGFSAADIDAVLRQTPSRVAGAEGRVKKTNITEDSSYEMFVWHGEIEPEKYEACTCLDEPELDDDGNPIDDEVSTGLIMICNERLIGAMPSWIEPGEKMPVSVACWRATDDSPYGLGIPDEQEDQQSVVNAAWRQLMDHGRYTVGVQFIRKKKGVNPAIDRDDLTPTPNRMWDADDSVEDVRKAMAAIDVPSHLGDYLNIVKAAMEYSDTESNMPALLSGSNTGNAHETLGGMAMLFNNATTTLRHRVRGLDDNITDPQVQGYYNWNMDFHPDPKIKAEAKVITKGSTVLLEKDIQNQLTLQAAAVLQNPKYEKFIDPEKELDILLRAMKMRPESLKRDAAEVKQLQENPPPAPQDPKIVAAEMNMKAKELDIADRKEQRAFEAVRNQAELGFRHENLRYNSEREDMEYRIAMNDQAIKRDTALIKLDADVLKSREGIIAKQRMQALQIDAENQRMNAELATKARMGSGI